jgi:hypothetical protein
VGALGADRGREAGAHSGQVVGAIVPACGVGCRIRLVPPSAGSVVGAVMAGWAGDHFRAVEGGRVGKGQLRATSDTVMGLHSTG